MNALSSGRMAGFEIPFIEPGGPLDFPPVEQAVGEGILAIGGDLSVPRMLFAYESGIFPWYMPGDPIVWWAPEERCVLNHEALKVSKSLRKSIRTGEMEVRIDTHFTGVLAGCADRDSTWLTSEVADAFSALHEFGFAHSFETWKGDELVGGLFGVAIGRHFSGDSMFSRITDASKMAFVHLVDFAERFGFGPLDCQIPNPHLHSLGAATLDRSSFMLQLKENLNRGPSIQGKWTDLRPADWPLKP